MRPRIVLFSLAAIIIVILIVLGLADELLVDLLWFGVLGYRSVFLTQLGAQVTIFAGVWFVAFIAICTSGFIALGLSQERERLHIVRRSEEMTEVNLPELIRALGDRIPWRLLVLAASALLGLFAASGEASSWDTYLKGFYAAPFGHNDPAFGKNLAFYVFTLPLLEDWRDLFMLILFLTAVVTGMVFWARGALDFRDSPPRISRGAAAHFSVLLAFFFVQRAMNYWLSRPELLLHSNGVVYGLRYVDHVLWEPGLWLLVLLSLVAAAISLANLGQRGLRLPVIAAIALFGPAIFLNLIQPVIEKLYVKPDELRVEGLARTGCAHRQQYPAMGSAPAARDLPPAAGNPALLRFFGRRHRPLLDQRQVHGGDALAPRAQYLAAARQRPDLGQPPSQVHPRQRPHDEPGQCQG